MNVINDPWLYVKYLDGSSRKISVRQAFIDAEKIKDLDVPIFNKTKAYIYNVPVIQFLTTLIGATYFKPEYNFKSGKPNFNRWLMDNWDISVFLNYFDQWIDRFELFDDNHPFLQEPKLKSTATVNPAYVSIFNPLAPSTNYSIFGNFRNAGEYSTSLDNYQFDETELVYILLYLNAYGTTLAASTYRNKAISYKATLFSTLRGKNLKETLIYNCLDLTGSRPTKDEPDIEFDRPVWELNSLEDIKKYDFSTLSKNVLLCNFFPCYPVWVEFDGQIKNAVISRTTNDCIFDEKTRDELSKSFIENHPYAIKRFSEDPKGNTDSGYTYREWVPDLKLINLCIDITKKLPKYTLCNVLDQDLSNVECVITYREFLDKYKTRIVGCGEYIVAEGILEKLKVTETHDKAETFQSIITQIRRLIQRFGDQAQLDDMVANNCLLRFVQYSERYFFNEFIPNIEDETTLLTTTTDLSIFIDKLVKSLFDSVTNPVKFTEAYKWLNIGLSKLFKEELDG